MEKSTSFRHLFIGLDQEVPLLNGGKRVYINLDNAASTPPMRSVQMAIDEFMPFYASVHRGTGFKSQLSTHAYEAARRTVLDFLGADPQQHTCIFGKNTTDAINKLARRYPFTPAKNIVLTSGMEHHSNDLPWRYAARTIHIGLTPDGQLNEAHFDDQLEKYAGQVALVAISGASNVTGYLNPIHRLAQKAHRVGAHILVDAAQLAPHRQIQMLDIQDPAHLDFVTISAHKLYAPFGTGALVGRIDIFKQGDPDQMGGGTVEIVTLDNVVWAGPPDRDEAGSPNTVGAVALAAAINQLNAVGMDKVAQHEADLTRYALERLNKIDRVVLYGDRNPEYAEKRLGVLPLTILGISHFKVAAILGYEFGIGVRSGCFCAHPYILHLLGLTAEQARQVQQRMIAGDKSDMPGLIRASFGLYNSFEEIDAFIDALEHIVKGAYRDHYIQDRSSGEYKPSGWSPDFEQYFRLQAL